MDIKPIETRYKDYRFRSRLEARWAVFFDALHIPWKYENEGYDLGDLGWYLPDFELEFDNATVMFEIKHDMPSFDEIEKAYAVGARIIFGSPGIDSGNVLSHCVLEPYGSSCHEYASHNHLVFCACRYCGTLGFDGATQYRIRMNGKENLFYSESFFSCGCCDKDIQATIFDEVLKKAHNLARSARFEHGESPKI